MGIADKILIVDGEEDALVVVRGDDEVLVALYLCLDV
jgi:hypothetical protein